MQGSFVCSMDSAFRTCIYFKSIFTVFATFFLLNCQAKVVYVLLKRPKLSGKGLICAVSSMTFHKSTSRSTSHVTYLPDVFQSA